MKARSEARRVEFRLHHGVVSAHRLAAKHTNVTAETNPFSDLFNISNTLVAMKKFSFGFVNGTATIA